MRKGSCDIHVALLFFYLAAHKKSALTYDGPYVWQEKPAVPPDRLLFFQVGTNRQGKATLLLEEYLLSVKQSVIQACVMAREKAKCVEPGVYHLKREKHPTFFTKLEERLSEEVNYPTPGYKTTYRRCRELQARLLAKYAI